MSILGAAGAGLRTWAAAYLRPEVMRDHRLHDERLTADGPFRRVRNPLYLGNILMAAGMGLSASRPGAAALVALMTLFGGRLILREEAALEAAQGEDYATYRAAVPRLLPALRARVPPSGNEPAWGPAFRAEVMIWFFALAMVALAVGEPQRAPVLDPAGDGRRRLPPAPPQGSQALPHLLIRIRRLVPEPPHRRSA
jgi:hypothetical protein